MDEFPVELNRATCFDQLTENEKVLMKEVRKTFYEDILKKKEDCGKTITLKFPDRLWEEHRVLITTELLDRFGELTVFAKNGKAMVTKMTTDKSDIPSNIDSLKIEFYQK